MKAERTKRRSKTTAATEGTTYLHGCGCTQAIITSNFFFPTRFVTKGNIMGKRGETGTPVCGPKTVHVWCVRAAEPRASDAAAPAEMCWLLKGGVIDNYGLSGGYFGAGWVWETLKMNLGLGFYETPSVGPKQKSQLPKMQIVTWLQQKLSIWQRNVRPRWRTAQNLAFSGSWKSPTGSLRPEAWRLELVDVGELLPSICAGAGWWFMLIWMNVCIKSFDIYRYRDMRIHVVCCYIVSFAGFKVMLR